MGEQISILTAFQNTTKKIKEWTEDKLDTKVNKDGNKKLSDENYTASEKNRLANMATGLVVLDDILYLKTDNDYMSESGVDLSQYAGSGGGGGSTGTAVTLTNKLEGNTITTVSGNPANLVFEYTSTRDTGNGTAYIYIGTDSQPKASITVVHGENTIDISPYLNTGTNIVKITCMDKYSNNDSLAYTVNVEALELLSTFSGGAVYSHVNHSSGIRVPYVANSLLNKIMHFVIDGKETTENIGKEYGEERSITLKFTTHGVHTLKMYFTVVDDNGDVITDEKGNPLKSNEKNYEIIYVNNGTDVLISSVCPITEATQGDIVSIPYTVYDPQNATATVELSIMDLTTGSVLFSDTLSVERAEQIWNTRNYPASEQVAFTIKCGTEKKTHIIKVKALDINVSIKKDGMILNLTSAGRSNSSVDGRDVWSYTNDNEIINTTFTDLNWVTNGWMRDDAGDSVLRLSGEAKAYIDFEPFKTNASDTTSSGLTLELEFAIRDVNNRDAVAIKCLSVGADSEDNSIELDGSEGVGFIVTSDTAIFRSKSTSISCHYTEDEKIHMAFVVDPRYRLILTYLNGVLSSAAQYPDGDIFQQNPVVGISIGSQLCSVDMYNIRAYNTMLTSYEIQNNYIASITDIAKKVEIYSDNDIYDDYKKLSYYKLKEKIPTAVITGQLPTGKNDKYSITYEYNDPFTTLDFKDTGTLKTQGTSSLSYPVKNFKVSTTDAHQFAESQMAGNLYCLKADFAESTSKNNCGIANYVHELYNYNYTAPFKGKALTPPQIDNPLGKIRSTIYGHPIVLFNKANSSAEPEFVAKYNMNWDKGSLPVYGFTDQYPDAESWEFCRNDGGVVEFLAEIPEDWSEDFEARQPDGFTDISNFKRMHDWVMSTNGDIEKFKNEFEDYFNLPYCLIYYLLTSVCLQVDQRAKNVFMTTWDKIHWEPWIYDCDTAFGISNMGYLAYNFWNEDHDKDTENSMVFNGANSVLWCNFREAYADEIQTLYQQWRSNGLLSYEKLVDHFITNHTDKWSIAVYNTDMEKKYVQWLKTDGNDEHLGRIFGTGEEYFKYFIKNRIKYCDSKWFAGDYSDDEKAISFRTNSKEATTIKVTPYSNCYVGFRFGGKGKLEQQRAEKNQVVEFNVPVDESTGNNQVETYIYGASEISSIGDLSKLYCGTVSVDNAPKLTELIIGSTEDGYKNDVLDSVAVGANNLLQKINVSNCPNLKNALDLSKCPNIREVYCSGSGISSVSLPESGYLRTMHLPASVNTLNLINQHYIEDLQCENYSNLSSVTIVNTENVPLADILTNMQSYSTIRLWNVNWDVDNFAEFKNVIAKLRTCNGKDASNNVTNTIGEAIMGRVNIMTAISEEDSDEFIELFASMANEFPYLTVSVEGVATHSVTFLNSDENRTVLKSYFVVDGTVITDPLLDGMPEPTKAADGEYEYIYTGWSETLPLQVHKHYKIVAQYNKKYAVRFHNVDADGNITWTHTQYQMGGDTAIDPVDYDNTGAEDKISIPERDGTDDKRYQFIGWSLSPDSEPIEMPIISDVTDLYAIFANVYPVRYYATENAITPYYVQWIKEGEDAYDPIVAEECSAPAEIMASADKKYVFAAWDNIPTNIIAITQVYATYDTYWAVRFYNESTVVNTQWIKNGEDAIDPVKNNIIDTPTKVSTAQYDFTFSSWDGDYTNVTEARKIYATYSNTTRRYTVEFYNIENGVEIFLWKQEEVPYGSDAVDPVSSGRIPTPTKLGVEDPAKYDYTGWNPSYKDIQGNTKCYAMFRYNAYITDDWATIAANANNGTATTLYPIGARKEIPVMLSDGIEHMVDVEIIAYNHDDLADGSGKAVLTFLCKDLPTFEHKMYNNQTNSGGWKDSDMRAFVNGEVFDGMPTELQNVIRPVSKISDGGANSKTLVTTEDKCWVPSYDEVGFANNRTDNLWGQGVRYADTFGYGSDGNVSRIKYLSDDYTSGRWWLRTSSYGSSSVLFLRVQNSGGVQTDGLWNSYPVAFGFCVGESPVEPGEISYGNRAAQIASTYQLARALGHDGFEYSTNSLFSEDTAGDGYTVRNANGKGVMDCSTFVGLCLRGIPYENSPFAIYNESNEVWWPADELESMYGTEGWEFRDLDKQPAGKYNNIGISGYSSVRLAADYGEYFSNNGQVLFDADVNGTPTADLWKTLELQPGDLLFWSKADAAEEVQGRFKKISHVAIVSENTSHFLEVTTGDKVVLYSSFEDKYEEISLICRPHYGERQLAVDENVLSYPWVYGALQASTIHDIVCTTIDENTIHLSGTSTATINRRIKGNTETGMVFTLPAGTYKLSGMNNTGVANSSVSLQIKNIDGTDFETPIVCYAGNDPTFTIRKDTDIAVILHIDSGCILDCNITPALTRTT